MQFLCMQFNILKALNYLKILIAVTDKAHFDYLTNFISFETIIRYFLPDNLVIVQAINIAVLITSYLGEVLINYYGIANSIRTLQAEVDNKTANKSKDSSR